MKYLYQEFDDTDSGLNSREYLRWKAAHHPAPILSAVVILLNVLFVAGYAKTHQGLGWTLLPLVMWFGAGFPLLFDQMLRRHFRNRIVRMAWLEIEELFYGFVVQVMADLRPTEKEFKSPMNQLGMEQLIRVHLDGFLVDLCCFSPMLRDEMRKGLLRLKMGRTIQEGIRPKKPLRLMETTEEKIYLEGRRRWNTRLFPDLGLFLISLLALQLAIVLLLW